MSVYFDSHYRRDLAGQSSHYLNHDRTTGKNRLNIKIEMTDLGAVRGELVEP